MKQFEQKWGEDQIGKRLTMEVFSRYLAKFFAIILLRPRELRSAVYPQGLFG